MLIEVVEAFEDLHDAIAVFMADCKNQAAEQGVEMDEYMKSNMPMDPPATWKPMLKLMADNVKEVINTPVALGSGSRALPDKASGEVHKWRLLVGENSKVDAFANTFCNNTTDLGVEVGLGEFRVRKSCTSLLPVWMQQAGDEDVPPELDIECASSADTENLDGPLRIIADEEV